MKLYFASSNRKKILELSKALKNQLISVPLDFHEIQTTELRELVKYKIQKAHQMIQAPVIVEDTSLYFEAWNELPGPLIKWFLNNFSLEGIVQALSPFENKFANAVSCLGFTTDGKKIYYFEEKLKGKIVNPRGSRIFGWDSIFEPIGHKLTFGEMTYDKKILISPRGKVASKFKHFLKQQVKQK